MSGIVKVSEMADAIAKELEDYNQEVTAGLKTAVLDVAEACKNEICAKAPKRSGKYRKGWRVKKEYESETDIRCRVHNATSAQLTHLLENGHPIIRNGRMVGKAGAIPHIRPAEQKAEERLVEKTRAVIEG